MAEEDDQALQEEQDPALVRAPWTIKSVSRETRDLVMEAAASRGESAGAWLERVAHAPSAAEDADRSQRAPWQIKGVLVEVREAAVTAAMKRGQRMGEWIETAVLNQMRFEAGDGAVLPTKPGVPPPDMTTMTTLLRDYVALAASAKVSPDKGLVEEYAALLRELMRRMREAPRDPQ